ncbi:hypothetical protein BU14_0185s0024 [Porphyra umbilicalis]|uniref:Uncharacterized protein n=1 Tax=Porphyra umbilicalis TaxID=2786 RepID=A0A1X6P6U8_PORUM|nr:hypothetical protein BU14_0185s0024 [Porphyra umbilicalis]|eukprot:OSX76564.1 hypothetical protein BU14_0185s0024 [Porphyra umbilicalis]
MKPHSDTRRSKQPVVRVGSSHTPSRQSNVRAVRPVMSANGSDSNQHPHNG